MSKAEADLSRYMEIRTALTKKIMSGEWRPGHRVPPEHELMGQFSCSRMTVNKALSMLAASGLIVRKRRSGTFVASPQSQTSTIEVHDIRSEIISGGYDYRYAVLSRRLRKATRVDVERMPVLRGVRLLAVTVLHFASDLPFVLEERIISLATVPDAVTEHFVSTPPGTWLLDRIPWTQAEHIIRAEGADAVAASALGVATGTPCLVVERKTWQADAPVTWVRLSYPGDRHQFVARFAPAAPVRAGQLPRITVAHTACP